MGGLELKNGRIYKDGNRLGARKNRIAYNLLIWKKSPRVVSRESDLSVITRNRGVAGVVSPGRPSMLGAVCAMMISKSTPVVVQDPNHKWNYNE